MKEPLTNHPNPMNQYQANLALAVLLAIYATTFKETSVPLHVGLNIAAIVSAITAICHKLS